MSAAQGTHLPPLLVVAAALISADGRVLVQQRPTGKQHAGLWEFPGGKVETGEYPETALVRELAEELGITVARAALTPLAFSTEAGAGRLLVLLLYRVHIWSGEPRPIEAPTIRWVSPAELVGLPMPPADIPLVSALSRAGCADLLP
ncbi:(deoxy)nucleoside triphosphate pyrophosphohydrolase [Sphingomonas jeddahensis]|uniref:8-oxo-dGTP diphosphatase n=1 Tax=Sphingomonas jeddahensis TaxID=1915074 RepID=A0A1V2ETA4_9SPHN|nr:(deoxy)nucleoside triphosphate pyrophosphohydrolase [Sphingomonas jeddahensis]ONF95773.1 CTP pyrophosphohydrolase [Sphingomonas jeddahensis]